MHIRRLAAAHAFAKPRAPPEERCDGLKNFLGRQARVASALETTLAAFEGGRAMSAKDYVVKDISLADWGRKEIEIA